RAMPGCGTPRPESWAPAPTRARRPWPSTPPRRFPARGIVGSGPTGAGGPTRRRARPRSPRPRDRKSTRLNSCHVAISYAVFCLKKKKKKIISARYTMAKKESKYEELEGTHDTSTINDDECCHKYCMYNLHMGDVHWLFAHTDM